ncbi:class I SAM-dependent methyltransferase (plasmid) [Mesorhizobium mediterraneum]|uniref:SAM-dependent methyltransferase n=1 Tax=Mesorhizobium mediterraneum TaxID=43617 RepID=A0AB36R1Y8_9HYPH|nr:class I SAM-dependent methyltransferase [Mesorhizobium mediterraneum]PAP98602.1 SAM-dependent methyltransferase [Mesorhizobium mediterraneum]WIW57057.1 class I SAM-dependent methyltransferase [Mesorhizobium mediterraneum]
MDDDFVYDQKWALNYEEFVRLHGKTAEVLDTVNFLERYSSGRNALELGIGDGRVAVPLSERGVRVEGIDNSDSMLQVLAERTDMVKAWKGDIADFRSEQRYRLVYCVYNTFKVLFTREAQLACFRSVAEVLDDQGSLVLELDVPALEGFVNGQKITTLFVDHENTILNAHVHDPLNQNLVSSLLWFSGTSVRRLPHRARYVYHQELDTMAELVGLKLVERWGDWAGGAFTEGSKRHISVYSRTSLLSGTFSSADLR